MDKLAAYEMILEDHPLWEKSAGAMRLQLPSNLQAALAEKRANRFIEPTRRSIAKKLGRVAASENPSAAASDALKTFMQRGEGRNIHARMLKDPFRGGLAEEFRDHKVIGESMQAYKDALKRMSNK